MSPPFPQPPSQPPLVTLGLDPRGLHLTSAPQVQSPRVKPEGDNLGWGGIVPLVICIGSVQ